MEPSTDFLTDLQRRHGPLHSLIVNAVDQWRWMRQLQAMERNPTLAHFNALCALHGYILDIPHEEISSRKLLAMKQAWQRTSNALASYKEATQAQQEWLQTNRLAFI